MDATASTGLGSVTAVRQSPRVAVVTDPQNLGQVRTRDHRAHLVAVARAALGQLLGHAHIDLFERDSIGHRGHRNQLLHAPHGNHRADLAHPDRPRYTAANVAFELLFALLLFVLLLLAGGMAMLLQALSRRSDTQSSELAELRAQLALGGQNQGQLGAELRGQLGRTQELLEGMRQSVVARQQIEDDARQSLRRLEAVIAGSSTRGAAGENILEEAFQHLPPEMLERNHWVKGKVVEFALRLPGGKLLPIDSKWTAGGALQSLSEPDLDPARRSALAATVEREVEKRVREVSQYIDPQTTTPFALAAIPDGAYAVCRAAFAEAHRRHVIVVGFSMAMPYLLSLYQLHLQFSRSVDMDNLQAYLIDIERQLDGLEGALENKLRRAMTMLENTYSDGKQTVASVRASVHGIQLVEHSAPAAAELSLVEPVD